MSDSNRGLASADEETHERVASEGGSANTPRQQQARRQNIRKAQQARRNQD